MLQIDYGKAKPLSRRSIHGKKVFNEFCDASTIHGLKYLGTRPLYEK